MSRCKTPLLLAGGLLAALLVALICVAGGSVRISLSDSATVLLHAFTGNIPDHIAPQTVAILLHVRLPRVATAALVGAALSLSGGAMQGLLKNPLADGSTLGVSAGASLGAVLAIALGSGLPLLGRAGTTVLSMVFAFASLVLILWLAHLIDYSLATNTIILIGVIFSMFAGSATSLLATFAGDKVKDILFWNMGSFSGRSTGDALLMAAALLVCGAGLLRLAPELNAFAVGEDNARHIGVDVRRVKLAVMVLVAVLIGVAVSVSGAIGFVGLVIPHITRLLTGPNHKRLLPLCLFTGAVFLMLADLVSRTILSPIELPIGVVTSFVGSLVFVYIFYRTRRHA